MAIPCSMHTSVSINPFPASFRENHVSSLCLRPSRHPEAYWFAMYPRSPSFLAEVDSQFGSVETQ